MGEQANGRVPDGHRLGPDWCKKMGPTRPNTTSGLPGKPEKWAEKESRVLRGGHHLACVHSRPFKAAKTKKNTDSTHDTRRSADTQRSAKTRSEQ